MSDSSTRRDLHCYASDLADFQKMADKLATLRRQLDYLNRAWERVFEANAGLSDDPSGSHPEHVNHVVSSLGELKEIKLLALLIGPARFHGGAVPSEEQLAAERRFRHLVGLDVDSKVMAPTYTPSPQFSAGDGI